ncbi:MAG: 6-phosphofructokinase [Gammaproteobacteria bacterium]|jgi:6-phosphofructokinase
MPANALYAQAGGVTAVINATACGVVQTALERPDQIGSVYAAREGIIGVLREDLIDLGRESEASIASLRYRPGGAFGACRFDLGDTETHRDQYDRLLEVFAAHDIGYFFYNGGNGSMLTALKVAGMADARGYPLRVIGLPKTIDNDLIHTDNSPGYGSAAKFIATSVREAALDVASMYGTSTRVFILETMGRNAGWLAAAAGLAFEEEDSPLMILFAERPFEHDDFLKRLRATVDRHGYCVVAAAEGVRDTEGRFISIAQDNANQDWIQLGGAGPTIAQMVRQELGCKVHWAVADYLQRSARHIASKTDVEQAYAMGRAAVDMALAGEHAVMPVIERLSDEPYRWQVGKVSLAEVADLEWKVPPEFIRGDGYGITAAARRYLKPLIEGEDPPPFRNGLPDYPPLCLQQVERKLEPYTSAA